MAYLLCQLPFEHLNNFLIENAPFINMDSFLIPAWINNSTHYEVWDDITYPFDATVEVSEWVDK